MGPVEALKLALAKENDSIALYEKLNLEHPVLKETLIFLINEGYKHRQLIEKKIYELTK